MSHDLSFLLWLPRHALALTLAALLTLATQPASAAAPPPNPELSKAERAEVEAAACGSEECVPIEECEADDSRDYLLGLFTGYFDGGTTLEAFASVQPCTDGSVGGIGIVTRFLRREGTQWLANDDDKALVIVWLHSCRVVRDGDRDVLLCWTANAASGSGWAAICSVSRVHGTHTSCPIWVMSDFGAEACTFGSSESAEVTGVKLGRGSGSALVMEVQIKLEKKFFSTKGSSKTEYQEACQRAYDWDAGRELHGSGKLRREKHVVRIPLLKHRLKLTRAVLKQIQALRTETILLQTSPLYESKD
jgi:hypothetical protein